MQGKQWVARGKTKEGQTSSDWLNWGRRAAGTQGTCLDMEGRCGRGGGKQILPYRGGQLPFMPRAAPNLPPSPPATPLRELASLDAKLRRYRHEAAAATTITAGVVSVLESRDAD
ncbi:hypothetical protein CSOJ01_09274 [Colletotrichum sojae]|uniref:Uncharacterized protein n=1 Tax=Colletotrichum sojae TaxID=2175907 RepID=A0A8H6J4C7_9PEZI|nr:hypothetical protein CSOJ01_09274 [Colletotrichum sojae]